MGKHTGIRELVDQGLLECRIASGLCPAWDLPAVEWGIILTNFGAHQEALQELERVGRELPEPTPHWRFAVGYVLMELERFPEGLEHLEQVSGSGPAMPWPITTLLVAPSWWVMGSRAGGMPRRLTGWASRRCTTLGSGASI